MIQLRAYVDERGRVPVEQWIRALDRGTQVRITAVLARMEDGNFGDSKSVGSGVMELRLRFGPGYRVYYGRDGSSLVLLLAGGDKSTQTGDVAKAQERWAKYKTGGPK